jgi:hypothetical protein
LVIPAFRGNDQEGIGASESVPARRAGARISRTYRIRGHLQHPLERVKGSEQV